MSYSDFDLPDALSAFSLTMVEDADLFSSVTPVEPSELLNAWLADLTSLAVTVNTEKMRSEFLIAPVLAEARRRCPAPMTILSGVPLDVDGDRGLNGVCDFLLARTRSALILTGPLVAVVEAKREDIPAGMGQCAASMVAVREFNARAKSPVPAVYGVVTTGTNWRFLRLVGDRLELERREYYLVEPARIVGILVHMVADGFTPPPGPPA